MKAIVATPMDELKKNDVFNEDRAQIWLIHALHAVNNDDIQYV